MSIVTWTFDGVSARRVTSDEFDPWFPISGLYTKDVVLDARTAADSYTDIGAWQFDVLEMRWEFTTEAARDTMINKLLTIGTLSNSAGRTTSALLVRARRVNGRQQGSALLDVTFERR
jgi:hypothetical protein